jgi:hypothetical protein
VWTSCETLLQKGKATELVPSIKVKRLMVAGHLWLTPIILATQEAEFRRITFKARPGTQFVRPHC